MRPCLAVASAIVAEIPLAIEESKIEGGSMGDKSPKSKDKAKKQDAAHKKQEKAAHDAKQAPPAPTSGRGK